MVAFQTDPGTTDMIDGQIHSQTLPLGEGDGEIGSRVFGPYCLSVRHLAFADYLSSSLRFWTMLVRSGNMLISS